MKALAAAVSVLLAAATARADAPAAPARHVRLTTPHGPLHVFTPAGYDPATASLVVFIHGYATTVDEAWNAYKLQKQFAAAKLDAMFVAIEAPSTDGDQVVWSDFSELRDTLAKVDGFPTRGRVIAVAHSGGYRTVDEWLPESAVDTIVLLDAGYSALESYADWLAARTDRRLIDVAELTRPYTDPFHSALGHGFVMDIAGDPSPLHAEEAREHQVVYVRSHFGHFELVTGGVALPSVLHLLKQPAH